MSVSSPTPDELDWSWGQAPRPAIVGVLELKNSVLWPWDKCWRFVGKIRSTLEMVTWCGCNRWKYGGEPFLVQMPIVEKINAYGEEILMVLGTCPGCNTVYWASSHYETVIG